MDGPITPGFVGWIYDFQNLVAGVLALGAGLLAYLAGKHQAKVSRKIADDQIGSAIDLQTTQRRDEAERVVNVGANIVSQIQFEAAILHHLMEIALAELDRVQEMKAAGMRPYAENITHRLEKIDRFLGQVWLRLEPIPLAASGPIGRLITWLDDLATRCADFRTTLESDGHMPIDIWKRELQEIRQSFADLNSAITDLYAEPSIDPADALKAYQDKRIDYAKNYVETLKKKVQ